MTIPTTDSEYWHMMKDVENFMRNEEININLDAIDKQHPMRGYFFPDFNVIENADRIKKIPEPQDFASRKHPVFVFKFKGQFSNRLMKKVEDTFLLDWETDGGYLIFYDKGLKT